MVVIAADTEDPLAASENIVVFLLIVVVIAFHNGGVVADLHSVHAMILRIVRVVIQRPVGVVIGDEEAILPTSSDDLVNARRGMIPDEIRFVLIKELHLIPINGHRPIGTGPTGAMLADMLDIIRVQCHKTDMGRFLVAPRLIAIIRDAHLVAVQREKILVCQLRVGNKDLMVGIGDDGIALCYIEFLHLGRCESAIRDGGVAVQIGFVEIAFFRK
jgi:hypothetical protein